MLAIVWMSQKELRHYFGASWGYAVLAAALMVEGLLFNAWALGSTPKLSTQVLETFFYNQSGATLLAAIFVGMRCIAEERQTGTWTLLASAPIAERDIIVGKWLGGLIYLLLLNALTLYMPALVAWHGKVAIAHIGIGYLGQALLGGATLAVSMLCSAWAPNQMVAAALSTVTITTMILLWLLSRVTGPPLGELLAYLSLHDKHFRPFVRGVLSINDVVFYVTLIYLALTAAIRVTEMRRWQ